MNKKNGFKMARSSTSFKPGDERCKNNSRPKGSKNRTTQQMREFIQLVVDKNIEQFEADLLRMSPSNRWQVIEKMSKYFMPALTKSEVDQNNTGSIKIEVSYEDEKSAKTEDDSEKESNVE